MAPDGTTYVEKVLTGLGAWGALRSGATLVISVLGTILLLEFLTPSLGRLFRGVPSNLLQFSIISVGLLLGVTGHFIADLWDRVVFAHWYGPRGSWLEKSQPPLLVFPAGTELKRLRAQAVQALPKRPESDERSDRAIMKVAQRQLERWERIEHPLLLGQLVRGLLWPSVFAALVAVTAAVLAAPLGAADVGPSLLGAAAAFVALTLLILLPYTSLRVQFLLRLYQDVAAHPAHHPKRKPEGR